MEEKIMREEMVEEIPEPEKKARSLPRRVVGTVIGAAIFVLGYKIAFEGIEIAFNNALDI